MFIRMKIIPDWLVSMDKFDGIRAGFVERVDGVCVTLERGAAVSVLEPEYRSAVEYLGFKWEQLILAEQVHGCGVTVVSKEANKMDIVAGLSSSLYEGVDGLITQERGVILGIYVADCGAIFMLDKRNKAIGLLHSGKNGTELGIFQKAFEKMKDQYGTEAEDLEVVLAPCIRPPYYEIDFAADIRRQVLSVGVPETQFFDSGLCTASDLDSYYSYRMEKGKTGRMLALFGVQ